MKKVVSIVCSLMMLLLQVGCVEIRDENEAADSQTPGAPLVPAMVDGQQIDRVVIEGEMFVFQGRFVSRKDLEYNLYKTGSASLSRKIEDVELHIKEMIFTEGSILYTLGHRVRLHVDHLNSAQGRIQTFAEGTKAPKATAGRPGGHLFLNIGKAEAGHLFIEMRGEEGGDGLAGAAPDNNMKGVDGRDSLQAHCAAGKIPSHQVGGNGGPGKKGHSGGNGAAGGNSGTLEISIKNGDLFAYHVYKYPGLGGQGGPGGRGGEGGKPGRTVNVDRRGIFCPLEVTPKKGADGEAGIAGSDGKKGVAESVCVTRNAKATCF